MNAFTAKLFDEDEHKVVTHFLDMCLSKSATAERIFQSVNGTLEKHEIPWGDCLALGVDNVSVNVGKHKSLILEVQKKNPSVKLMECPCHIIHIATIKFEEKINGFKKKSSKDSEITNTITLEKTPKDGFNSEEFLVD